MKIFLARTVIAGVAILQLATPSLAGIREVRECYIRIGGAREVRASCLMTGTLNAGLYDVKLVVRRGGTHVLKGPLDRQNGADYLLDGRAAKTSKARYANENCYARMDGALRLCIGGRLD